MGSNKNSSNKITMTYLYDEKYEDRHEKMNCSYRPNIFVIINLSVFKKTSLKIKTTNIQNV